MQFAEINYTEIQDWLKEYKTADINKAKQLKEFIVLACMPLVKKISRSFARRATDPIEDISQVGAVGLIKAIDLYNPEISTNFKTYATYLITGEIRHYLRDKSKIIRAPREIQELSFRIHQLTKKLTEKLGAPPSDIEIAKELEMPVNKVEEIINLDRRTNALSMDQLINSFDDGNSVSLSDKIADDSYQNLLSGFENKIMLNDAISRLDKDLKEIILLNYFDGLNQREISDRLKISQMQVSRKIKKALNKLFEIITSQAEHD